ncbi:MAG TPA: 2-amino-4-hydroxy-6-hydroxymethyldihydropteridine diphosphokinase [Acetobacteraceae bacterium]|nr:2-amino-4-hydroxy-6-hydroxymethyldihydropteridine diphosphokinase [Acetobacteraceae bacterium]
MKTRPAAAGPAILVAIGANLPGAEGQPPLATCRQAAIALDAEPGLRLRGLSRWWRTAPLPPCGQPDYVNGIALLTGEADPARLLRRLHEIEAGFGRRRSAPNAARTLDLDLIAIGDLVRDAPDPVLPHPRAHLRAFVLRPLADVLPEWTHPRLGKALKVLLAACADQSADPIAPSTQ